MIAQSIVRHHNEEINEQSQLEFGNSFSLNTQKLKVVRIAPITKSSLRLLLSGAVIQTIPGVMVILSVI